MTNIFNMTADAGPAVAEINRLNGILAANGVQLQSLSKITQEWGQNAAGLPAVVGSVTDGFDALGNSLKIFSDEAGAVTRIMQGLGKISAPTQLTDALHNRLGGLRNNFTNQGVVNVQKTTLELQKLSQQSGIADARMLQLFDSIRNGSIRALGVLTVAEVQAEIALRKLVDAFNKASTAGQRSSEVMLNFRTALRLLAIQQAHLAISKITNAILSSIDAGKEYETRIAEIQTISQKANRTTDQWSGSLKNLSNEFGLDILKTTEAAYEAISNQIAKGAGVTVFLSDAFTLARTTSATAEEAVNILSSAINAYGTSAINAERYSAVLFKVADLGRVRVGQLANTFGNTATLAHNMGISIEELGAAIATLTIQGIRPDTSMTLINNIMLKLIKPTKEMTGLFNDWGVASGEAAIATFGFSGVLSRLDEEYKKGGVRRLGEIGNDMRAIRGQVGLTGQAFGKYSEALNQMIEAQKDYEVAAKLTAETMANKLNKEFAALHNLFVTDAVQRYNKEIIEFSTSIGGLANSLKSVIDGFGNTIAIAANISTTFINMLKKVDSATGGFAVMVPTVLAMVAAYKLANVVMASATVIQAAHRAGVVAAAFPMWNQTAQTAYLTAATRTLTGATVGLISVQAALTLGIPLIIGGMAYIAASSMQSSNDLEHAVGNMEAALNDLASKGLKDLNRNLDKENQDFEKGILKRTQTFNQYVAAIRSVINSSIKDDIDNINNSLLQFQNQRNFEFKLVGADEAQKFTLIADRVKALGDEIKVLHLSGDIEGVESKFKTMSELAKGFTDSAVAGIEKLNKQLKNMRKEAENKSLENQLLGLKDPAKMAKIQSIIDKLRVDARKDEKNGDKQAALDKMQEAIKLDDKLESLRGSRKKAGKGGQPDTQQGEDLRKEAIKLVEKQLRDEQGRKVQGMQLEKEAHLQSINGIQGITDKMKALRDATEKSQQAMKLLSEQIADLGKNKATAEQEKSDAETSLIANIGAYGQASSTISREDDINNDEIAWKAKRARRKDLETNISNLHSQYKDAQTNSPSSLGNITQQMIVAQQQLRDFLIKNYSVTPKDSTGRTLSSSNDEIGRNKDAIAIAEAKANSAEANRAGLFDQRAAIEAAQVKSNEAIERFADTVPGAIAAFEHAAAQPALDFKRIAESIEETNTAIINSLRELHNANDGKAVGGGIGFAGGGLLSGPLGRDNRSINAHSGEFMMNERSTAKFHSTLVAMNSGGSGMKGLSSNGPSINVGDINVNLHGNNNQSNAQEVARLIRRNVRSGVSKLS